MWGQSPGSEELSKVLLGELLATPPMPALLLPSLVPGATLCMTPAAAQPLHRTATCQGQCRAENPL